MIEVAHRRQEVRLVVPDLVPLPAGRKISQETEEEPTPADMNAEPAPVVCRH